MSELIKPLIAETTTSQVVVNKWHADETSSIEDCVAEELPVAMIYNGISHAVMLATPQDLEDFALGFSLAEGILSSPKELYAVEVVQQSSGLELRMEIASERFSQLKDRRRSMTGRTGCGLCGAESLAQALRLPNMVNQSHDTFHHAAILKALKGAASFQILQAQTGATHASFWVQKTGDITMVREDVGRHNAVDSIAGLMWLNQQAGEDLIFYTTGRLTSEMVIKGAQMGIPFLLSRSGVTAMGLDMANQVRLTLLGRCSGEHYLVYSGVDRIIQGSTNVHTA